MSAAFAEIKDRYGPEAALDMERIMRRTIEEQLLPQLVKLQQTLATTLRAFTAAEMMSATELQKRSFRNLKAHLKKHPRLLLLYKSSPSAVLFDAETLEQMEEQLSATIAAFHWEAHEGRDVSPEEFWTAMEAIKPGRRDDLPPHV